jgi:hypothetical protein
MPPTMRRLLVISLVLVGSIACGAKPKAAAPRPPTSDYAVYSALLRRHFAAPAPEEHVDGLPPACDWDVPATALNLVRETSFRRLGGASRDSSLAEELSTGTEPLLRTLRALDAEPDRALNADSFPVGVPVRLVDGPDHLPDLGRPIYLSRVAYDADSTVALVHATQLCRDASDPLADPESDPSEVGRAVLAALRRGRDGWAVTELVYLVAE